MSDFFELLKTRRSIRNFKNQKIPTELVKEIISDSCLAPSSGNGQPWNFVIINNADMIKRLSDESKKTLLSYIEKNPDSSVKRYKGALENDAFNVFYNAPCLVIITGPKDLRSLSVDCTLCAAYFMFSASARGLGTCWIGLGAGIVDPETLSEIGILEDHVIVAPIIIGYPAKIPKASRRNAPNILKVIE
jgi:nitroreductase